jgi:hypothetical protein
MLELLFNVILHLYDRVNDYLILNCNVMFVPSTYLLLSIISKLSYKIISKDTCLVIHTPPVNQQ